MYYLDINTPMINFQEYRNSLYVDKTLMIDKIQKRISTLNKYICITRPRRFGKTMNANMLAAYFTKGYDSRELFKGLKISKVPEFEEHMNQHHVIYIDLSRLPDPCTSFQEYLNWIKYCLLDDLKKAYHIEKVPGEPMQNLFERTNDKFMFILDEWDSIFYKTFINDDDKKAYLEFLKGLLKDQPYVELAYMTGVLPILQYSKGSELNMFREYNFMNDKIYESYFGFTENEVRELCEHCKNVSYENLKYWYDGYHLSNGDSLFNPRSVNNALSDGVCQNYWTETGPMHEISNCIKYNVNAVREDIVKMVSNIPVRADLEGYAATQLQLDTRDEILSSMVVFGFLSYYNGFLTIPNHELMIKFQNVLKEEYMGGVSEIVRQSNEILKATIDGNADKVAEMIEVAHDKEIPFLQYNNENSMSCVITLCYLSARNDYEITREDKSGKGYVDFLFTPKISGYPAIILELKYDKTAGEAIQQIKDKNYIEKINNIEECLFVGINYAKKDKKHTCLIEKHTHKV